MAGAQVCALGLLFHCLSSYISVVLEVIRSKRDLKNSLCMLHNMILLWYGYRLLWSCSTFIGRSDIDILGSTQFGRKDGADLFAGAGTAGLGRKFKNGIWSPTFWAYYDYASGDADPNSGNSHTFNQLYPFGHYYLGWIDQVARQNIHDVNLHLHLHPQNWITILAQYHHSLL